MMGWVFKQSCRVLSSIGGDELDTAKDFILYWLAMENPENGRQGTVATPALVACWFRLASLPLLCANPNQTSGCV